MGIRQLRVAFILKFLILHHFHLDLDQSLINKTNGIQYILSISYVMKDEKYIQKIYNIYINENKN